MFYMVNPSKLKKKKKKSKKSKRRNPELLIVNPYSLSDEEESETTDMAKRKTRKKRRKSRKTKRRRKNPLTLRGNPGLVEDFTSNIKTILGGGKTVLTAAVATVLGGGLLAVTSKLLSEKVGKGSVGQGVLAVVAGAVGGAVVLTVAQKMGGTAAGGLPAFLTQAAVPGAAAAMTLGMWKIFQVPVETFLGERGLAGYGDYGWYGEGEKDVEADQWVSEFGYTPYGDYGENDNYYNEWSKTVSPGGYEGWEFGDDNPFLPAEEGETDPFLEGLGYEPLGDIYNEQRLGSFEAEPGLGGFVPETANPRDQQVADKMKAKAGVYGDYEGFEGFEDYGWTSPFDVLPEDE